MTRNHIFNYQILHSQQTILVFQSICMPSHIIITEKVQIKKKKLLLLTHLGGGGSEVVVGGEENLSEREGLGFEVGVGSREDNLGVGWV